MALDCGIPDICFSFHESNCSIMLSLSPETTTLVTTNGAIGHFRTAYRYFRSLPRGILGKRAESMTFFKARQVLFVCLIDS